MSAGAGPGRRLTEAEESRALELYQAGASQRVVGRELSISRSSAQALRTRLIDSGRLIASGEPDSAPDADPDAASGHQENTVVDHSAELAALQAEAAELAALARLHEERAAASRQAVQELEAERLQVLAAGRDALPLRPRMRDAADDQRDSEDAARLATARMDTVAARIADLETRQYLADLSGELAAAVAERDATAAKTGQRQRAAVLAVRDAAQAFVAALADEQAAVTRVEQLAAAVTAMAVQLGEQPPAVGQVVSSALWIPPDMAVGGKPLALARADTAARQGQPEAVAELLGTTYGWLPPSPAERAAEEAEYRERAEALAATVPKAEAPTPWTLADPAAVGLDARGHLLPPRHPRDFYYNAGAVWGNQQ